jgi:uncharacterized peroxidase-related enzyme
MIDRFAVDWRTAGLDDPTAALLAYTEKLTRTPGECGADDVDALRAAGWSDRAIHDATQVCSYFNYINRIADGLGVAPEDWIDELGRPFDGHAVES